jgi:hypothetical protein
MDSQNLLLPLFVQSLTVFLATPAELPHAGSGHVNGCLDPNFPSQPLRSHIGMALVEAGSNTSTVALRVVGGDKWVPSAWEYDVYPGNPVPGGYKCGDLALQVGEVSNLRQ